MQRSSVCTYDCLSRRSTAAVGLLLGARPASGRQQAPAPTALSSKRGQCHIYSCRKTLNADLFFWLIGLKQSMLYIKMQLFEKERWSCIFAQVTAITRLCIKYSVLCRRTYIVKYAYTLAQILSKIWLLIVEIALLTDTVKQTIIYVKCCADPFRYFGCIFSAFV